MAHEEFRPKDMNGTLAHLVEECGEVLAAAGKTLRYGLDSVNPLIPVEQRETNGDWLLREMKDLSLSITSLTHKMVQIKASLSDNDVRFLLWLGKGSFSTPIIQGTPDHTTAERLCQLGHAVLLSSDLLEGGRCWYQLTRQGYDYADIFRAVAA